MSTADVAVVVDVVVDVDGEADLNLAHALEAARTGPAECGAETAVRELDGQGPAAV